MDNNTAYSIVHAKLLALGILGIGSFVAGSIPAFLSRILRFPLLTSFLLCFGAGVLMATSLVHMLPDVRRSLTNNVELYLCGGFFFIYFVDEFVHFLFGEAIRNSNRNVETRNHEANNQVYGSINNLESSRLLRNGNVFSNNEPHQRPMTGTMGLLIALSLHSVIEGLAIGVQTTESKVLLLLLAISCHKFVMSFCLGLECCVNTLKSHLIAISVFSLGSVVGIGLGMIITDIPAPWQNQGLPILQAFAAGTLLYITVSEVIPREKAKLFENSFSDIVGLIQLVAIASGFSFLVVLNFYLNDDE
ncbi:hypothetical protein ACFFRR_000975 [Megaselia abdita]